MGSQPGALAGCRCRRGGGSPALLQRSLWALLLLAAASAAVAPAALADWRICNEGVFVVDSGGAEPEVATRGQDVVFSISGTLGRSVTGGVLEVWVDYLGFHVYSKAGDLCEAVPCPLAPGRHTLRLRQRLPRIAPPGPYLGVFQATASDGALLFCVDLNFRVAAAGGGGSGGGGGGDDASAAAAV